MRKGNPEDGALVLGVLQSRCSAPLVAKGSPDLLGAKRAEPNLEELFLLALSSRRPTKGYGPLLSAPDPLGPQD